MVFMDDIFYVGFMGGLPSSLNPQNILVVVAVVWVRGEGEKTS